MLQTVYDSFQLKREDLCARVWNDWINEKKKENLFSLSTIIIIKMSYV